MSVARAPVGQNYSPKGHQPPVLAKEIVSSAINALTPQRKKVRGIISAISFFPSSTITPKPSALGYEDSQCDRASVIERILTLSSYPRHGYSTHKRSRNCRVLRPRSASARPEAPASPIWLVLRGGEKEQSGENKQVSLGPRSTKQHGGTVQNGCPRRLKLRAERTGFQCQMTQVQDRRSRIQRME